MTTAEKSKIVALRKQNLTYQAIADTLGIPVSTIKTYCRRNGIVTDNGNGKKICKNCGADLSSLAGTRSRLFCSTHCKQTWWNKHRYDRASRNITQVTCLNCGEEFFDYSGANRKYCSLPCYHKREVQHGK